MAMDALFPSLLLLLLLRYVRTQPIVDCGHGTFDKDLTKCVCDEDWKHSGPTDPLNFATGACYQFQCQSNDDCKERLGIPEATCPVPGWDCECGWEHVWNLKYGLGWLSPGYQTWGKQGAACQGVLYTLSFSATESIWLCMRVVWRGFLGLMVLFVFFGQTPVRCQCHDPSTFRLLRAITCSRTSNCDGRRCMTNLTRWNNLTNDLAWSIYIFDVGLWVYAFLLVIWATGMVVWLFVLWLAAIIACIVAIVTCVVTALSGGGGDMNCDCNCNCNVGQECQGCCDCQDCYGPGTLGGPMDNSLMFYSGGPLPGDNSCNCDCSGQQCCGGCSCTRYWLCAPVAWLFLYFPRPPSNFEGGVLGVCLGTHPGVSERRTYVAGSYCLRDFIVNRLRRQRGSADLHGREDWRQQVFNFLQREDPADAAIPPAQNVMPQGNQAGGRNRTSGRQRQSVPGVIQGRNIERVNEHFQRDRDKCANSSFEDYEFGTCWLCCENTEPTWDLWERCGHLFCSRCSSEMLRRRMPCPLCRVVSFRIKRGPAKYQPAGAIEGPGPAAGSTVV